MKMAPSILGIFLKFTKTFYSLLGRISARCVKVTQKTFDIELMCHDMAQKLCQAAGKKYWYVSYAVCLALSIF